MNFLKELGVSKIAAVNGITQTIVSRICMVAPAFILTPLFMERLKKLKVLRANPGIGIPTQILICGLILTVSTPAGLAM